MHEATYLRRSPLRRAGVRLGLGVTVVALTVGVASPAAIGDTVKAKQQRAAAIQAQQRSAAGDVAASQSQVQSATDKLLQSQSELDAAQARLNDIRSQLSAARAYDAELAAKLKVEQAELAAAKAATIAGIKKVDEQRRVMGESAREQFQQQSDLMGVSVMFGSESTADLAQRVQWSTTIFDAESHQKRILDEALVALRAAQARQAEVERKVAADKAAAAAQVKVIAGLEASASAQAARVATLVAANETNKAAAQGELAADEARYRQLSAEEARLQKQSQPQSAAERAAARPAARAEARRRAAAKAAAEKAAREEAAARAAAARARNAQDRAAKQAAVRRAAAKARALRNQSAASTAAGVVGRMNRESSYGFTMPVNATPGSSYGLRFHPILHYWRMHNGTDFGAACGMPLYAAASGRVLSAGRNGGFGNFVLIGHGLRGGRYLTTGYAHQSRIAVRPGQRVRQGQLIGYVGTTGLSTGCHLHFEVRLNGVPTNPLRYLP